MTAQSLRSMAHQPRSGNKNDKAEKVVGSNNTRRASSGGRSGSIGNLFDVLATSSAELLLGHRQENTFSRPHSFSGGSDDKCRNAAAASMPEDHGEHDFGSIQPIAFRSSSPDAAGGASSSGGGEDTSSSVQQQQQHANKYGDAFFDQMSHHQSSSSSPWQRSDCVSAVANLQHHDPLLAAVRPSRDSSERNLSSFINHHQADQLGARDPHFLHTHQRAQPQKNDNDFHNLILHQHRRSGQQHGLRQRGKAQEGFEVRAHHQEVQAQQEVRHPAPQSFHDPFFVSMHMHDSHQGAKTSSSRQDSNFMESSDSPMGGKLSAHGHRPNNLNTSAAPHSPVPSSSLGGGGASSNLSAQRQLPQHPASAPPTMTNNNAWEPLDDSSPLDGFPALPFAYPARGEQQLQFQHRNQRQQNIIKRRRSSSLGGNTSMLPLHSLRNVRPNLGQHDSPVISAGADDKKNFFVASRHDAGGSKIGFNDDYIDLTKSTKPSHPADAIIARDDETWLPVSSLVHNKAGTQSKTNTSVTTETQKKTCSSSKKKNRPKQQQRRQQQQPQPSASSSVKGDSSVPSSSAKSRDRARKEAKWLEMLSKLREYKAEHGDCVVPRGWAFDTKLASWVAEQRKQYRLKECGRPSNITEERVALLEGLDFAWNAQEAAWSRHFQDLKKYKEVHGDCMVPLNFTEYPQLGLWVKEQRRHYTLLKQKKHSHMTPERITKLESVSFTWDSHEAVWWERFRELQQYHEYFGDCLVPTKYSANPRLGTWVHHQRRQYRMLRDGMPSHMTQRRINVLEGIGFNWAPRAADRNNKKEGGGGKKDDGRSGASSTSSSVVTVSSLSPAEPNKNVKVKAKQDSEAKENEEESVVGSVESLDEYKGRSEYDDDQYADESFEENNEDSFGLKQAGTKARAA